MPESISTLLQGAGSLGVLLAGCFWALNHLDKQLTEVRKQLTEVQEKRVADAELASAKLLALQEKRIADAQLATAKLLELVDDQHTIAKTFASAIDGNADSIRELRMVFEALTAERGINRLPGGTRRA